MHVVEKHINEYYYYLKKLCFREEPTHFRICIMPFFRESSSTNVLLNILARQTNASLIMISYDMN